ncbi:hypothetical protein [Fibrobacter sp. UBA4297]|uniref:hypothetical protein n=1 Tax=Fibrobacter sp. UBA4297 TaxID=1946536 RepID=UPI0025BA74D2|nr:hypothetical protein [Fibrobacter sp. UBA4297]
MIHMNLIAVAEKNSSIGNVSQHLHVTNVADVERRNKRKYLAYVAVIVAAFLGLSAYLNLNGVPAALDGVFPDSYLNLIGAKGTSANKTAPAGPTVEEVAKQREAIAKARAAMPVSDIVNEIKPQALFNNKRTSYSGYLPLEKLSFQKKALPKFLTFLNTSAPDDIGFSECVFQAPNYYYLRGIAMKASSQHTLMDRLKAVSRQFQSPIASEAATEVAAFGQFNVTDVQLNAIRNFVATNEIAAEVRALKSLAATNKVQLKGLEKPVVEDFGVFKRYAYNVTTTADFADLLNFLNVFSESPIRMGVPKADLRFAKKNLVTALRIEMLVLH